jgi:2'-5' RNA ligase
VRLFVAVDLPDVVRRSAAEAAASLKHELGRARARSRISWVAPAQLHLTLVFLGEVDDGTGAAVVDRMREPLPLPPFAVRLGHAGLFPPSGRPRVLWLAVAEGAQALVSVHAAVEQRLAGIGYRRETRAYAPHLTLARFKEGGTPDERRAIGRAAVTGSPAARVRHVTLYRSVLSPGGPEYTVLAESALAGVA